MSDEIKPYKINPCSTSMEMATGAYLTGVNLTGANWNEQDKIWCGFWTGTMAEFESRILETHEEGSKYRKQYLAAVRFLKEAAE